MKFFVCQMKTCPIIQKLLQICLLTLLSDQKVRMNKTTLAVMNKSFVRIIILYIYIYISIYIYIWDFYVTLWTNDMTLVLLFHKKTLVAKEAVQIHIGV